MIAVGFDWGIGGWGIENLRSSAVVAPTQPTTAQTSVIHGGAEYFFSSSNVSLVPVTCQVGFYADGQPFVMQNANYIFRVTPDPILLFNGVPAVGNGLMINPWLKFGTTTPGSAEPQGFEQLLTSTWIDSSEASPYTVALNKEPTLAGNSPILMTGGQSLVKAIRKPGISPGVSDADYPLFSDWCVLHVVIIAPPLGAFAPSSSDLDKTSYYTTAMRDKGALGTGFALSSGMPSLATCEVAPKYFSRSFQPFFGQGTGERMQPMIINPKGVGTSASFYSAYYSPFWSDFLAAILQIGSSVDDDIFNRALAFGLNLIGLTNRQGGGWGAHGAGQACGYKQFAQLVGHVFDAAVPGTMAKCLSIDGNATGQTFWVTADFVGTTVEFPGGGGLGNLNSETFLPVHVGLPWFSMDIAFDGSHNPLPNFFVDTTNTNLPGYHTDSDNYANYQFVSGPASFMELLVIMMLKNGPGGKDGSQVIIQGSAYDNTNQYAACIAYYDRYFTFPDVYYTFSKTPRSINFYNDRRNDAAIPRWHGVPEAFNPMNNQTTYVFPVAGGVGWDLTNAAGTTETVLEWDIEITLDQMQWFDVDTPGITGTQTGLPLLPIGVRHRRRSASGWGPYSVCYQKYTGTGIDGAGGYTELRNTVTPTGSPSNAAPIITHQPQLCMPSAPDWLGPSWVVIPDGTILTEDNVIRGISVSIGFATGQPGPTFTQQKIRSGVLVGSPSSNMDIVDETKYAGLVIAARFVATNTQGSANADTDDVTWYGFPDNYAQLAVHFDGADRFRRTANLVGGGDNKKFTIFASGRFTNAIAGSEYIFAAGGGTSFRLRRSTGTGQLGFLWSNAGGSVSLSSVAVLGAGEKWATIISVDADATSREVTWTEDAGDWDAGVTDASGGGAVFDLTTSMCIGSGDGTSGTNFMTGDMLRFAMWIGVAPDLTNSANLSSFLNRISGNIVDPAYSNALLGVNAIIDFYGNAADWNNLALNNKGTGGPFGIGGTVTDVLAAPQFFGMQYFGPDYYGQGYFG